MMTDAHTPKARVRTHPFPPPPIYPQQFNIKYGVDQPSGKYWFTWDYEGALWR